MTRNEIAAELFHLLNKTPETKKCVTYALVQIRKILDFDKDWENCSSLRFFCDWALHTHLDRKEAKRTLSTLDEVFGRYRVADVAENDPSGKILDFVSFQIFRNHLFEFLRRQDLPTVWAEDDFVWNNMLRLYSEQVCHTPLTMTRKDYKFKYLQKLVIASLDPSKAVVDANPQYKHFGFTWEFVLSDGQSFKMPFTSNLPEPPAGWKTLGVRDG
jgi:hypothetical protein